ncbi:SMI1/KNR4 family protein [Haloferula sp. BvORR071]|uniref:SMI1/KNR4 family protein n=1 Tax=Haloferula sp. BvORR071 TaxID=1396141 RepID=UPI000695F564|nr:SMI1/KNR4 family protein [Haloferula sp. BvORR071]
MKPEPTAIWGVPAYLPYVQPELTDEAIAEVERKIGYRLPEAYLALLRVQNGGYIRLGLPDQVHDVIAGIGPHYPALEAPDWDEVREYVSFPLDGLVPFDGDGHWHLCLDYRENPDSPKVTLADVECDHETPIADSFEEYLSLLTEDMEGDELVLPEVQNITALLEKLGRHLGVTFEDQGAWGNGYPVYRATSKQLQEPNWIWISPNTVSRGFVRENDERYEEVRDYLPGQADRYPDLPPDSYIVSATAGWDGAILRASRELEIPARPFDEYR